jgi:hypothetical protein
MNRFEQFNMREFEFITFFLWHARGSRSAAVEWQQALINEADEALDIAEERDRER